MLSAIRSSFSFQGLSSWRYECSFRMFPFFSLFPPSPFPSSFSAGNSRYRERDLRQLSEPGRDGIHFPSIVTFHRVDRKTCCERRKEGNVGSLRRYLSQLGGEGAKVHKARTSSASGRHVGLSSLLRCCSENVSILHGQHLTNPQRASPPSLAPAGQPVDLRCCASPTCVSY